MELIAIEKGIHLFVQKPMTLDMKYAKKVLAGIKKKKLVSAVGLQCRYAETLDIAKRWVAGKQIGMVSCYRLGGMPKVWWWRVKKESGGRSWSRPSTTMTSAAISLAKWWVSQPVARCHHRRRELRCRRRVLDHSYFCQWDHRHIQHRLLRLRGGDITACAPDGKMAYSRRQLHHH